MSEDPRSERGILSKADRKILLGISGITQDSKYNRRADIRERVEHGIRDFEILLDDLNERDRAKIADEIGMDDWADAPDGSLFLDSPPSEVVHALAFLYLLHDDDIERFERTVSNGVAAALQKERAGLWRAEVDIDPQRVPRSPNEDRIREKIQGEHEGGLNGPEAQWFFRKLAERHTPDEVLAMIDPLTAQEHIQRGISENKLTLSRLKRLNDEEAPGIEAFPDPREVEARQARTPYDDE